MICPICKEEMPLLSKVCPLCGHVLESEDKQVVEFVNKLEKILHDIKALPQPSFVKSMGKVSIVMVPLLALIVLLLFFISSAGIFLILSAILIIWSIVLFVKKIRGKLGNDESDRMFAALKNDYVHISRVATMSYGKSREVSKLLENINEQIYTLEEQRKSASKKNFIIWIIISAIVILLSSIGSFGVKSTVDDKLANGWKESMEAFEASGVNDEYDSVARLDLIGKALAAGAVADAEAFYVKYCNGLIGDVDCAIKIVEYHLKSGNKVAAKEFIAKCNLRYNSDMNKLRKLLTE